VLQKLLKGTPVIPAVIFVILLIILFVSIGSAARKPEIDSISPAIGYPGGSLVITGSYFGEQRGRGEVLLAGIRPVASAYESWSSREIRLKIPENVPSGLVYVSTDKGRSKPVLFTNGENVPEVKSRSTRPGAPVISGLSAEEAAVGDVLVIRGRNFGFSRNGARVVFTTNPELTPAAETTVYYPEHVICSELDFDYEYWSDLEVRVRVPDGALSGWVSIENVKGKSNRVEVYIDDRIGTKLYTAAETYAVQQIFSVYGIRRTGPPAGEDFYLWLPRPDTCLEQRSVRLVSSSHSPFLETGRELSLFKFSAPFPPLPIRIERDFRFERYGMETRIISSRVGQGYDMSSRLYTYYTGSSAYIPSNDKELAGIAAVLLRRQPNPYLLAYNTLDYVLSVLEPLEGSDMTGPRSAFHAGSGTSFSYASLYCSLLRAAGVPSRINAGFLAVGDGFIPHFWSEFYIEDFGWVPVDSYLAEGLQLAAGIESPKDYYFGSLDNRHITVSRGCLEAPLMYPQGKRVVPQRRYALQTVYLEYMDNIADVQCRAFPFQTLHLDGLNTEGNGGK
jgi:hypothetical protein